MLAIQGGNSDKKPDFVITTGLHAGVIKKGVCFATLDVVTAQLSLSLFPFFISVHDDIDKTFIFGFKSTINFEYL